MVREIIAETQFALIAMMYQSARDALFEARACRELGYDQTSQALMNVVASYRRTIRTLRGGVSS